MYDVSVKVSNGINDICANTLSCLRAKGAEIKSFRIDSGVKKGCVMACCTRIIWCYVVNLKRI